MIRPATTRDVLDDMCEFLFLLYTAVVRDRPGRPDSRVWVMEVFATSDRGLTAQRSRSLERVSHGHTRSQRADPPTLKELIARSVVIVAYKWIGIGGVVHPPCTTPRRRLSVL